MGILFISWLAFKGMGILWNRNHSSDDKLQIESLLQDNYWLTALYLLLTPILALIFLYIAIAWFTNQGLPHSLLQKLTTLIWLWAFYRFLITLLFARFGESLQPYRNWIMTPIFLFLATYQILSILPGSIVLVDAIIFFGETSVTVRNLLVALMIL